MKTRTAFAVVVQTVVATAGIAAPPDAAVRFQPSDRMAGAMVAATGSPLARGAARPTRPRAEAFSPGQLPAEYPTASRVLAPFRADPSVAFPDRLIVVFYATSRPVRVQVSVQTSGKPLADRWANHLKKLFAAFDRDGDGYLNRYELEYVFPPDALRLMFQGGTYSSRIAAPPPVMEKIDRDGDSRVSFPEFAVFYRDVITDLIRSRPLPSQAGGEDTVTRELFARLDQDKDGKLSEMELRSAEKILLALDADEDECVSVQELLANPSGTISTSEAAVTAIARPTQVKKTPPAAPQELAVFHGTMPKAVVQQIIKRYDKNGDARLSREEIGFPAALFDRLDRNGDGVLSVDELEGWRTGSADAVVALELGDTPEACKASASPPVGGTWPAGMTVRQTVPGRLVLRVGSQTIEFAVTAPPPEMRRQQSQQRANTIFPQGAKSVTDSDLVGPQFQFLRVVFDAADFDGDGILTREEFDRYFALQQETTEIALTLSFAVQTPNLFQMLDDNLDGKLGVRELRTAWDRMIVLEPPGATAVTRAILKPNGFIRLASAAYAYHDANSDPRSNMSRADLAALQKGPLWFRKMDRNSDGDISRSEFLGSESDFQMLDTDGDGLITLQEALAYEKKARPVKPVEKKPKRKK